VIEARAAGSDRVRDGPNHLVLPDDPLPELVLEVEQLVALHLGERRDRDAGAARDDACDVAGPDLIRARRAGPRGVQRHDRGPAGDSSGAFHLRSALSIHDIAKMINAKAGTWATYLERFRLSEAGGDSI
jgi:hypothetical protein